MSLQGKNAIITGSSRGIGATAAFEFAKEGANVLINYVSDSSKANTEAIVEKIKALDNGVKVGVVQANLGDPNIGEVLLEAAEKTFGTKTTHILIHNGAISEWKLFSEFTVEEFYNVFNVNVLAPILITKAFQPYLPRGSSIILSSSIIVKAPVPLTMVYGASKASVEYLVKSWSKEWASDQGVRVNAILIGPIDTDAKDAMMQRVSTMPEIVPKIRSVFEFLPEGKTEDITDIMLFLASDNSRWVNGALLGAVQGANLP